MLQLCKTQSNELDLNKERFIHTLPDVRRPQLPHMKTPPLKISRTEGIEPIHNLATKTRG